MIASSRLKRRGRGVRLKMNLGRNNISGRIQNHGVVGGVLVVIYDRIFVINQWTIIGRRLRVGKALGDAASFLLSFLQPFLLATIVSLALGAHIAKIL
jgi:hypothetical protein